MRKSVQCAFEVQKLTPADVVKAIGVNDPPAVHADSSVGRASKIKVPVGEVFLVDCRTSGIASEPTVIFPTQFGALRLRMECRWMVERLA